MFVYFWLCGSLPLFAAAAAAPKMLSSFAVGLAVCRKCLIWLQKMLVSQEMLILQMLVLQEMLVSQHRKCLFRRRCEFRSFTDTLMAQEMLCCAGDLLSALAPYLFFSLSLSSLPLFPHPFLPSALFSVFVFGRGCLFRGGCLLCSFDVTQVMFCVGGKLLSALVPALSF